MIQEGHGNLLQADAEALVNTVNTVGYMGRGIALQFKQAFPANFAAYAHAVKKGEVQPGRIHVFRTGLLTNPRFIFNFPTKRHWRGRSRLEDIDSGLAALVEQIRKLEVRSIAVPPLGCGNGGLDWREVRPRIVASFEKMPDVLLLLFAPRGAPAADEMPIRTKRPAMTASRALLVKLMEQYASLAYRLTLLEIQKLAYLLQEAGEPLKLSHEPGHYGPFATNLNKALERMEGHLIRGYGDSQKPDAEIALLKGAVAEADAFLGTQIASKERLERVRELIEGFETPYGMELLSTVHWVAKRDRTVRSAADAARSVGRWNDRKRKMFPEARVRVAWRQLGDLGWIQPTPVLPEALTRQIRESATKHGVEAVRVFGSRARGDAGPESDLDLLIRLKAGHGYDDFFAFCEEVEAAFGRRVDVLTESGLSPYMRDRVLSEAVPL